MKCPHCLVEYHSHPELVASVHDEIRRLGPKARLYEIHYEVCPSCSRAIVSALCSPVAMIGHTVVASRERGQIVMMVPRASSRPPCPSQVPEDLATDYAEACLVLTDSPKASAALSRRCLQHLLREHVKVKHQDLAKEIQEVLDRRNLPTAIAEALDAIRNIGNFAAHPMKATATGEVLPVEPGEAEWTLDVLESLFDYYFVQPSALAAKRASLDAKLKAAGKPAMKQPSP